LKLFVARAAVVLTHHHGANLRVADCLDDVHRQALQVEVLEVLGHRLPAALGGELVIERRLGRTLAGVDRRNALGEQVERRRRVLEHRRGGLAHHVDEAGRDDQPGRVDHLAGFRVLEPADGGDPAVAHADVGEEPGRAGAVDHASAADDDVVALGLVLR
jgi:hypothetical protein